MEFKDKLCYLMDITNMSNKALANELNVDASLISLFRTGRRKLPRNKNSVNNLSAVFAKHCLSDYQIQALVDMIGRSKIPPESMDGMAEMIADWLMDKPMGVDEFLRGMEQIVATEDEDAELLLAASNRYWSDGALERGSSSNENLIPIFYGDEQKKVSFRHFVESIAALKEPTTIYFMLEGGLDWFFQNYNETSQGVGFVNQALQRGHRIIQIFPPTYNLDDVTDVMSRWLPRYLTGQVESYYYPRMRDHLLQRTLMVCPGVAALSSVSVGAEGQSEYTLFSKNEKFIEATLTEFKEIMKVCRPAMEVFEDARDYDRMLMDYYRMEDDHYQCSWGLSPNTMPPEVVDLLMKESKIQTSAANFSAIKESYQALIRNLEHGWDYYDMIMLEEPENILKGRLNILGTPTEGYAIPLYTPKVYVKHLENIFQLIRRYPNYHPVIQSGEMPRNILIAGDHYAAVTGITHPVKVLRTTQPQVVHVFQEGYLRQAERLGVDGVYRERYLRRIRSLIIRLEAEWPK
ncbi:MAG: hypothetical protein K6C69_05835 [Lachnospiraceae bacterium]|nr:hypothetical protein [Lachnospiraceae bacterium]